MERMPLSKKEYDVILSIWGAINNFSMCEEHLKSRAQMIPHGWRDLKLFLSLGKRINDGILATIPPNKLENMKIDLNNARCEVKIIKDFTGAAEKEGWYYTSVDALNKLTEIVINDHCFLCEKNRADSKKCEIFKLIDRQLPWEVPPRGDECPLKGMYSMMETDK